MNWLKRMFCRHKNKMSINIGRIYINGSRATVVQGHLCCECNKNWYDTRFKGGSNETKSL